MFPAAIHHSFTASLGDLIAVVALGFAWLAFRHDRLSSGRADVQIARQLLQGLKERFFSDVGPLYFSTIYTQEAALRRARGMLGRMDQVFIIPREPIAALLADPGATSSGLISGETMVNATVALWQINKINELVRKQALFNATHAPDFTDSTLPKARRDAVATASVMISAEVHHDGIGNAGQTWYNQLEDSVDRDIELLDHRGRWWNIASRNPVELIGDSLAIAIVAIVAIAYANTL